MEPFNRKRLVDLATRERVQDGKANPVLIGAARIDPAPRRAIAHDVDERAGGRLRPAMRRGPRCGPRPPLCSRSNKFRTRRHRARAGAYLISVLRVVSLAPRSRDASAVSAGQFARELRVPVRSQLWGARNDPLSDGPDVSGQHVRSPVGVARRTEVLVG